MSTLKSTLKKEVQFILSKDCPAAKQSKYISAVGTGIFWFILLLILAFVPIGAKKAKYKVTQFEFDLLNTYKFCSDSCKFEDCTQLREMKVKGYFKDVDKKAKIHDILWNCGVIKDGNR